MIVIASIHQPSTSTFQLFDKLLLLSGGKQYYFGSVEGVGLHFDSLGFAMPVHINPAEYILDLMNTDFTAHQASADQRLQRLQQGWITSPKSHEMAASIGFILINTTPLSAGKPSASNFAVLLLTLVHRSFIKSYRDVVAYGIRIAMVGSFYHKNNFIY